MTDELRGSAPVYTAKDVLLHLAGQVEGIDRKMDDLNGQMGIILSQRLNERLTVLEQTGSRNAADALERAHENARQIEAIKLRLALFAGGIGVLYAILQVFGPVIQQILNVPIGQ